jgi:NO-binding membrane sensor protein with MHYT domain
MATETFSLEWNPSVVFVSFGIALLGSGTALNLCEQFRLTSSENCPKLYNKKILGLIWSGAIGGVTMFAVQLIAMRAITVIDLSGNKVELRYRIDLLLVSLVVVMIFCALGILLATKDEIFSINKVEDLEVYIRDSNNQTIGEMKSTKNRNSKVFRTLFKGVVVLVRGSIGFAAALIVGSYVAITSLVIDECTIEWNAGPLVGTILMMLIASSICCWILFRLLALYPNYESLRLLCSMMCAAAICGIHYCIIGAAITFVYVPGKTFISPYPSLLTFSQFEVYQGAVVASLLYSCIVLFIALADARSWFYRLSKSVRAVDEKIMNIAGQLNAIDFNGDSHENARLFINEFKSFITEYQTFKGVEEGLDANNHGLLDKPLSDKPTNTGRSTLFDVTGHMTYFDLGANKSFIGLAPSNKIQDSSQLNRVEVKESDPYCVDL